MLLKPRKSSVPVEAGGAGWAGAEVIIVMRVTSRTLGGGGGFSALCLGWWGGEGWWGGYLLLYVCESGDVGACACQGFLESVHLRSGDVLFRAQEPDDEQSKLVERLLAFCFIVQ